MIYLNLKGGLGNMMFQIAAAKSISLQKNTDYSFPNLNNHIDYLSTEMQYNPNVVYCSEYLDLPFLKNSKTQQPISPLKTISFPFHYEDIQINLNSVIIDGFFQSEKYFKKHEDEILKMFSPDEIILNVLNSKYSELLKNRTTSIHVRRGDYLKHSEYHLIQQMDYFTKSIQMLDSETEKFLIFSDDLKWCKEHFQGNKFVFIENEKDYYEMYLMSLCTNNIISNSSFSWWGAWLNKNKDKVVVGPRNWFGSALQFLKTEDIIPDKWIKL